MELKKNLIELSHAISLAKKNKVDLNNRLDNDKAVYDYSEKQKAYYANDLKTRLKLVKSDSLELTQLIKFDVRNERFVTQILELMPDLEGKEMDILEKTVNKMIELAGQLNMPKLEISKEFSVLASMPHDIAADINADVDEMNKCFNAGCYRSAIILCGRVLETVLHRKYYEATGNDLLEKSPGIGLGNIIVKLKEKEIALDPAITNQIHLINQVRIFSVHKKKEAFYPSKQQTQATILYTLDIVDKLFR